MLDITFTAVDAATVLDLRLCPTQKHEWSPQTEEIRPMEVISVRADTSDIAAARTMTVCHHTKDTYTWLELYDVSPNMDNNTIYLNPSREVQDGDVASLSVTVGTNERGWRAFQHTYIRFVSSDTIDDADTVRLYIVYYAWEKCSYHLSIPIAMYTENRHYQLGNAEL